MISDADVPLSVLLFEFPTMSHPNAISTGIARVAERTPRETSHRDVTVRALCHSRCSRPEPSVWLRGPGAPMQGCAQ